MITIGIDLGTTNSCAAFHDGRNVQMISLPLGGTVMPTAVSQMADGSFVTGELALGEVLRNPEFTFRHMKRQMGRKWNDDIDMGSAQLAEGEGGYVGYRGRDGKVYSPEYLSSLIIAELKAAAEDQLDQPVTSVMMTVPAYFMGPQKEATERAARMAGFEEVSLQTEPLAAAIASGVDVDGFNNIFVFDMGGGTFDVAVLQTGRGSLDPLGTNGDMYLGGVDFDERLVSYLVDRFKTKHGRDLTVRPIPMLALRYHAEKAKKRLTRLDTAEITLPNIDADDAGSPLGISETVTREQFESMVEREVRSALEKTATVLQKAKRAKGDIDHIVMVGGMTRMPLVQEAVKAFFNGKAPRKTLNPDEIVARGAAIWAARKDGRLMDLDYEDILSVPVGIEVPGGGYSIVFDSGDKVGSLLPVQFTNVREGMSEIAIGVYEGEHPVAADNQFLGTYRCNIAPGPAKSAEVNITFEAVPSGLRMLDEDGGILWQGDAS
ncbi:MAG: hypothetical protein CL583_13205 [Alteromonadaceae bacterium]|nr:hypothetical protein [Alteromonadaceae bacterium]|tara:strand:+ start:2149 stop:3621 length:1473 start_codon:yes stop_codon:yes gene_type:complete